jgi:hypothetical protein
MLKDQQNPKPKKYVCERVREYGNKRKIEREGDKSGSKRHFEMCDCILKQSYDEDDKFDNKSEHKRERKRKVPCVLAYTRD